MTVFFLGSERDAVKTNVATGSYSDSTGVSESPHSRGGVVHTAVNDGYLVVGDGVERTEAYWHFFTMPNGSANSQSGYSVFELLNQDETPVMRAYVEDSTLTTCTAKIQFWDGSAWDDSGETISWIESLSAPELHIDIYAKTTGEVGIYVNAETLVEKTVTWPSTTGFLDVRVRRNRRNRGVSQCIVSDVPMLDAKVWTVAATSDGTDTDASVGSYDDINDLTLDDSAVVQLDSAGDKHSFKADARTLVSDIHSVGVAGRLRSPGGGESAKPYLLIGGVRYYGDTFALTTGWDAYQYVWNVNPATSSPWEPSEVNDADLEWGWEMV